MACLKGKMQTHIFYFFFCREMQNTVCFFWRFCLSGFPLFWQKMQTQMRIFGGLAGLWPTFSFPFWGFFLYLPRNAKKLKKKKNPWKRRWLSLPRPNDIGLWDACLLDFLLEKFQNTGVLWSFSSWIFDFWPLNAESENQGEMQKLCYFPLTQNSLPRFNSPGRKRKLLINQTQLLH